MSLVNIYKDADRALIAVDTIASQMQLPQAANLGEVVKQFQAGVHTAKCQYLPHIGTAMAHRGDAMFANMVFGALELAHSQSFDDIPPMMPDLLNTLAKQCQNFRTKQFCIESQFPGAEIIVVGWSPTLGKMEGVRWTRWEHEKTFTASRIGKALMLPDAEWEQTPEAPDTPEKMERVARDQVAYVKRRFPDGSYRCGGRLLLAELCKDSLSVRMIADLE